MWRAWEHLHTQATTRSVRKALLSPEHKSRVTTDRPARTSVALQPSANEQALPGGAHTLPNNPFRSEIVIRWIVIHLVQTRKIVFVDQFSPGKDGWWIYRLMPPGWWNVEIWSLCSLLEIRWMRQRARSACARGWNLNNEFSVSEFEMVQIPPTWRDQKHIPVGSSAHVVWEWWEAIR